MMQVAASVVDAVGDHHAGRHLALLPPGILLETVAGLFATLLAGGTYVCPPQALVGLADPFRPDFDAMARAMAAWRITSTILVPEYLAGLVRVMEATGLRLPDLTILAVGGARVAPELLARARALGLPLRQGYGLTEAASVVALEARRPMAQARWGKRWAICGSIWRRMARSCWRALCAWAQLAKRRQPAPIPRATSAASTRPGACGSRAANPTC
jgi:acyl-CoA synthetase (AMP-forming)/AMP-acid ligase II